MRAIPGIRSKDAYLAGYLAAVRAFEVALELTPAQEMHHDNEVTP